MTVNACVSYWPAPIRRPSLESLVNEVEQWCTSVGMEPGFRRPPEYLELQIDDIEIRGVGDLLQCEKLLDAMNAMDAMDVASLTRTTVYAVLEQQVRRYLRAHPQLLLEPWLRNAGAVYGLIAKLGDETIEATQALAKFRLVRP